MRFRHLFYLTILAAFSAIALQLSGCQKEPPVWPPNDKPKVLTSIVPLHCFAATIAEPDAEVRCLLTSKGPHGFQPSPQDAKLVSGADLFIVNGLRLENWVDRLVDRAGNRKLQVLRVGEEIPKRGGKLIQVEAQRHGDHTHPAGDDPHVWLGIDEAKLIAEAIRDKLIEIDPAHREGYEQRTAKLLAELDSLKEDAKPLRTEPPTTIATFHNAFNYFGRSFGMKVEAIHGLEGEGVSPKQLDDMAKDFAQKGIRVITIEPQYRPEQAHRLRERMGQLGQEPKVIVLDPLETGPMAEGKSYYVDKGWYVQTARKNIENLKEALQRR